MKRITSPDEFQSDTLYWMRSMDGNVEVALCIPRFTGVKVMAIVSEMDFNEPSYFDPEHFLKLYDVVGPIPSMTKEEFQICFNKE